MDELVDKIKFNLKQPLPGPVVQYQMAPSGRKQYAETVDTYTPAAVLSLIYPKQQEWHMVFIQRTAHLKDKHSSQIAFPGGRVETRDKDIVDAALREAEEEIGINRSHVQVLGELTPLKVPVSRFEVFPVLAYANSELNFTRQVSEVERIIEVPLETLTDHSFRAQQEIQLSNGMVLKDVPIFKYKNHTIWGATSMMLNEIIEILT
ncbi:NUDIX hydrolase [Portibacter marinus]|uniref:NUDIX hydrolase n=1 Tax=Portibacter marinus TaxID=2898660 RepID=UPI001F40DBF0|nr:CoA pyrophosphatase [Portibacter marinus]